MFCKDIEQAQRYARAIYPDLADQVFEIPRQGWEYLTLLTAREAIRLPRHEIVAAAMDAEVNAHTRLAGKLPFPIPAIVDYQPDNHIMRMTRVPGVALSQRKLAARPEAQQRDIARQI